MKQLGMKVKSRLLIAMVIIAIYASPTGAVAQKKSKFQWTGTVTHVSDGDTLWVRPSGGGAAVNIRIDGIDAPEICQTGGPAAKATLSGRVLHQAVSVQGQRRDGYGRLLAAIKLGQTDVGAMMVSDGQAWAHQYKKYKSVYAANQASAQAARRGLFADASAEEPRAFRKRHGPCPH